MSGADTEGKRAESVNEEEAAGILKDPGIYGKICMSLDILSSLSASPLNRMAMSEIYGSHLMPILERSLRTALKVTTEYKGRQFMVLSLGARNCEQRSAGGDHDRRFQKRSASQQCLVTGFRAHLCRRALPHCHTASPECHRNRFQGIWIAPEFDPSVFCAVPESRKHERHSGQSCNTQCHPTGVDRTFRIRQQFDCVTSLKAKSEVLEALSLWMEAGSVSTVFDIIFDADVPLYHLSEPVHLFVNSCLLGPLISNV